MIEKHFVIDMVGWHTRKQGTSVPRERTIRRFFVIANFLQDHGLTTRDLAVQEASIDDDFAIGTEDLTDEGFMFMKAAYSRWLKKFDRGMSPNDTRVLESALKLLRPLQ